jgi:hypothetical protein
VAATDVPVFQAISDLKVRLPPILSHWTPHHEHSRFESLAFGLTEEEARLFIERRRARPLPEGWKRLP